MTLQAILPGKDLYIALNQPFNSNSNLILGGDQERLIIEGAPKFWNKSDCIVVVVGDCFEVLSQNVVVKSMGTLTHPKARNVFHFIRKHNLENVDVVINTAGIFSSEHIDVAQIPIMGASFNAFSDISASEPTFLILARKQILREKILSISKKNLKNTPKSSKELAERYERDKILSDLLKELRGYECQICGFSFLKADGNPYVEVHHLERLADGGLNIASNMIVLCANCHKIFHYAAVKIITHTNEKLVIEINGVIHSCDL